MNKYNSKVFDMQQYKIENLDEMKAKVALLTNDLEKNHKLSEEKYFDVRLILSELIMNAFKHRKKEYFVDVFLDDDYSQDEIQIIVEDYGEGFDYKSVIESSHTLDLYRSNGRGIKLVNALCEQVTYNDIGNSVSIVIKI